MDIITADTQPQEPMALELFDFVPEELRQSVAGLIEQTTLSDTDELTGSYVGDAGGLVSQNGRTFTAFKPPNQQRNVLFEMGLGATPTLTPLGSVPPPPGVVYYKDGGCILAFINGVLCMLCMCSPDPKTGGVARPVLWRTDINVGPLRVEAVDTYARQQAQQALTAANQAATTAKQVLDRLNALATPSAGADVLVESVLKKYKIPPFNK